MVSSHKYRGAINGVELAFDPAIDARRVVAKEHTIVTIELRGSFEAEPTVTVDGEAIGFARRVWPQLCQWEWPAGATAGYYEVAIQTVDVRLRSSFRVEPSKLTIEQYERMVSEVDRAAASLRFDFLGKGSLPTEFDGQGPRDIPGEYHLLTTLTDQFLIAIHPMLANPVDVLNVGSFDGNRFGAHFSALRWYAILREIATGGQAQPARPRPGLSAPTLSRDVNTPENAFARSFADRLLERWRLFKGQLEESIRRGEFTATDDRRQTLFRERGMMLSHAEVQRKRIAHLVSTTWLKEVRPGVMTPTFRMIRTPGFRDIYLMASKLQAAEYAVMFPTQTSHARRGLKPLDDIYELWAFFAIGDVLRELGAVVQPPDAFRRQVLRPSLSDNATMAFLWESGEGQIVWKPRLRKPNAPDHFYRSTSGLTPDFLIQVTTASRRTLMVVLDAKYRKQTDGKHVPGDLEKALKYFDDIIPPVGVEKLYSCILFPGTRVDRLREAIAVPLAPGQTYELGRFIGGLLTM